MVDTDEECDTWRNRDKYPKEREVSEKKASLSPVDQKTEKRPFNNYQSPAKSVEPPFKKQRNNFGDESNYNNNGSCINNNRRDGFDNRRDNFDSRKDSFHNRKDGYENRRDNFDYRKNSFDNRNDNYRKDNFDSRNDNFDNRKDNMNNRREPYDNRRDNFDNRFSLSSNVKTTEEIPNYPTQPQMLLFKHFLQQQDDDIEMQVAMAKYNEYKENFIKKQLKAFFDAHNSQEWFREKYLSSSMETNKIKESKNIIQRKEIFTYLFERQWMDNIKLHIDDSDSIVRLMDAVVILLEGGNENDLKILDSRRYRSESPNDTRTIEENVGKSISIEEPVNSNLETKPETDITMDVENKTSSDNNITENDDSKKVAKVEEARALHKTFSIFLRNLHPNVLRSEIEDLVKPYPGFLRLALQDPTPDRKFFRRGWVTYDRTVNIKEICWNLNNIRLHDCDIGAIVNRELTQRVRPVNVLTNHRPVMRQDIKLAAKLVDKFDKRHNLWKKEEGTDCSNPMSSGNPLLRNITEYLVDEGSYEEEALLGGNLNCNLELVSSGADPSNITIENDEKLVPVLDKLVLYLRFVHSYDYYSNTEYQIEDEMPHRCGIIHARGVHLFPDRPLSQKDVEEYIKAVETKADLVLNSSERLNMEEAKKLGYKDLDEVVEAFILCNTQEIGQDKWLCPLSGKKFKGPDFVRKHILNKHMDKVEEVKQLAVFFNNYLMDVKRPQLPEHPTNRPGAKIDGDNTVVAAADNSRDGRARNNNSEHTFRGGAAATRGDDSEPRNYRSNDRSPSPGGRNSNADGRGGNNGNYYRKNNFSSRGGRPWNGGGGSGSYYSRKMLTYNDLDAPVDD